jgi:hypothetical protein
LACRVANARRSFGYVCALRLAGQKNKFAKISPAHPAWGIKVNAEKLDLKNKNNYLYFF